MTAPRFVPCPQCRRPVEWVPASRWRPFCSQRCKTIDLGAWAAEAYRVPMAGVPDDEDAPPLGDAAERRAASGSDPD